MLIFYRIGGCDLVQKNVQGSEIADANARLLCHSHQAAACPIKHPLRNL
jgi:hypothetical protein